MASVRLQAIAFLLASLLATPAVLPKEEKADADIDYIALAAVLIRDGHYDRAEIALTNVDESREDIDKPRLFTLRGIIELKNLRLARAKDAFVRAVGEGQTDPMIFVYLAQTHFGLEEYRETIAALNQAGELAHQIPALYAMRAQAHWRLGERESAWQVLNEGAARFPETATFVRQKVFYLIELGLYQEATRLGTTYLERSEDPEQDYLAMGSALRKSRQLNEAQSLLEKARLRFPANEAIAIELAHVYLDKAMVRTAASIFEELSLQNPQLVSEAAELHRRSGDLYRALYLNAQIDDQKKKLKQRLAMLLEFEAYELAIGAEGALLRAGLLEDEDIRYALAYALYKAGRFDAAERHLQQLKRSDLFRKAAELRRAMEECGGQRWMCY